MTFLKSEDVLGVRSDKFIAIRGRKESMNRLNNLVLLVAVEDELTAANATGRKKCHL
jgi:hypothetical protein